MADIGVLSLTGAEVRALAAQAGQANAVLHLWQFGLVTPAVLTPLSAFIDAECDFAGYGELTIASWEDPFLLGQAWAISAAAQYFRYDSGSGSTNNTVGGWYLVKSTGELLSYGVFDPTRPMTGDGQVVIVEPVMIFPAG